MSNGFELLVAQQERIGELEAENAKLNQIMALDTEYYKNRISKLEADLNKHIALGADAFFMGLKFQNDNLGDYTKIVSDIQGLYKNIKPDRDDDQGGQE